MITGKISLYTTNESSGLSVSGHFAPWSFRTQSLRPNQKSVRPIIEVTSPHTEVTSLRVIIKVNIRSEDLFA